MKNIVFDIGNSVIKAGLVKNNVLQNKSIRSIKYGKKDFQDNFSTVAKVLIAEIFKNKFDRIGISLVDENLRRKCIQVLKEFTDIQPVFINRELKLPIKIKYSRSLGTDRIASAVAANNKFPLANLLVIDYGTATTFNIISAGTYTGGIISPGIEISLNTLISNTSLPYPADIKKFKLFSQNTDSAILSGVFLTVKYSSEGIIQTLRKKYQDLIVIATGGLSPKIKGLIDGINYFEKNLVLDGINIILNNNEIIRNKISD